MQKYKEINGNDYVKNSRTTINETMQSIQSMNSGTAFPTNNLFEGMKCYRTDLKKTYTLTDAENGTWVEDAHATLSDEATHAASATKLQTARSLNLGGAVTADAATFDGTANATINVKTLDATKLKGTASVSTTGNAATATKVVATAAAGASANIAEATMASNDLARIRVSGETNAGELALETADDGSEPIVARQYTGIYETPVRTAKILDESGNTSFPGTVVAPKFTGSLNGNAATATKLQTPRTLSLTGKAAGSATFDGSSNASINVTSVNADTATKLATARAISLTGDATGSANFDGSGNVSISTTVNESKHAAAADTLKSDIASEISTVARPIWLSSWVNGNTIDNTAQTVSPNLTYTCSTKTLTAANFKGHLSGNADTATTASNSNKLGGYSLNTTDGAKYGSIPLVKSNGVIELGQSINWHATNNSTEDFTSIWTANTNGSVTVGDINGTLNGTATNANHASNADKANTLNSDIASEQSMIARPIWLSWEGDNTRQVISPNLTYTCGTKTLKAENFAGHLAGNADTATTASKVYGIYTGNGGQQGPGFFGMRNAGFLMSNQPVNGHSEFKNWLYMDPYDVNDVGGATAIGVSRQETRAYIMSSNADRKQWDRTAELLSSANYNSFAPTKTGGGASGTWPINVSGTATNANSASLISPFEIATANAFRNVWFSDSSTNNKACYNPNIQYNPSTNVLKVGTVQGTATNADTVDGYHASDIINRISAANTGGIVAASLTENGYAKFANGLILQWGSHTGGGSWYHHTFPIAFSTVFDVIDGYSSTSTGQFYGYSKNITNTGFDMRIDSSETGRYIAIGI